MAKQKSNKNKSQPSGYIDITKQYGIPQFTEEYINKALELNKQYPGSKFICTANGCADIASQAANSMGHNFGKANAWEYGNRSDILFTNPAYAKELQNVTGPLHNPVSYNVPKQFLGMENVLVGLNRKDNLLDAKGNKLPNVPGAEQMAAALTREEANDSKDYANQELYKGSRGYEHVGYMMGNNTLLHGTGASKDHPAFFVLDDISNGIDLAGYGKYEPVEAIAEPTMMQSVGNRIKSLGNTASEMVFGKPTSKKADQQTTSAVAKKENGGWLDKYNDGGPVQPNYNDASVSVSDNFVGEGTINGPNWKSPAWGGQFAMGGSMPGAVGHMYSRQGSGAAQPGDADYNAPRTGDIPSKFRGKKTVASAQNGKEMSYYQNGLDFKPKSISKNGKKVIKDDRGQWDHPGEITEIGSNQITMQGVPYPVLGISDTGDTQMMYPNQDYIYDGSSVTEYPMAQNGMNILNAAKAVGQFMLNQPDSNAENVAEIFDPTGVSSWDDVYRSINNPKDNLFDTGLEIAGAVPLGKLSKITKPGIHLTKYKGIDKALYKNLPRTKAANNAVKGVQTVGRTSDAYQAYDQYAQGGQLTKLDQLTNFTNYNTKQPGGWLDKYQ